MIRSLHSKVLRTFKVFYVLFVQETVLWCDFEKLRCDILNFEFNHFMKDFSTYKGLLLRFSNQIEWKSLKLSLWSFTPKSFESVSIIDIIFGHVWFVSFIIITFYELSEPMSVVSFKCLQCRIFL